MEKVKIARHMNGLPLLPVKQKKNPINLILCSLYVYTVQLQHIIQVKCVMCDIFFLSYLLPMANIF